MIEIAVSSHNLCCLWPVVHLILIFCPGLRMRRIFLEQAVLFKLQMIYLQFYSIMCFLCIDFLHLLKWGKVLLKLDLEKDGLAVKDELRTLKSRDPMFVIS